MRYLSVNRQLIIYFFELCNIPEKKEIFMS